MKSVVIIDDDPLVRETVKVRLEADGYRSFGAGTGEAGLSLVEGQYPDLVLLDIDLPGKNGVRILKQMKQNHITRKIPVIMISSNMERQIVVQCIQAGAVDYVVKPLDMDRLTSKARRALGIAEIEKKSERRASEGEIELKRVPGVSIFVFSGEIGAKTVSRFNELYSRSFQAMARADEMVFDLRYQAAISPEQMNIIRGILPHMQRAPRLLAGRNFGVLLDLDLDSEDQLFISEEDLEKRLGRPVGVIT